MKDMMMVIPLIIMLISLPVMANNTSDMYRPLGDHPLHKGWLCHSFIGVMGLFLNSLGPNCGIKAFLELLNSNRQANNCFQYGMYLITIRKFAFYVETLFHYIIVGAPSISLFQFLSSFKVFGELVGIQEAESVIQTF